MGLFDSAARQEKRLARWRARTRAWVALDSLARDQGYYAVLEHLFSRLPGSTGFAGVAPDGLMYAVVDLHPAGRLRPPHRDLAPLPALALRLMDGPSRTDVSTTIYRAGHGLYLVPAADEPHVPRSAEVLSRCAAPYL